MASGKNMHPNSLANLAPKWGKGQCGNPERKNIHVVSRAELVAAYLERPSERDPDKTKLEMVLDKVYARALAGSDAAARLLVEQYAGRAQMRMHVTGTVGAGDQGGHERTSAEVRNDILGMLDEDERQYLDHKADVEAEMDQAVADDKAPPKN